MTDQEIILLIRNGNNSKALNILYVAYPVVRSYILKAGGHNEDAEDIFQESLLIFLKKAGDIRFEITTSLNAYIFGISKKLLLVRFRLKKKEVEINEEPGSEDFSEMIQAHLEEEKKYRALDDVLKDIGRKCLQILTLFYYNDLSMGEIASRLGLATEDSAKTQKYKCIEQARELLKNNTNALKN